MGGIDEHAVVEDDAATIWAREPGNQADGHRFAGTRAAEQSRDACIAREGDIEFESAELKRDVNADHAALSTRRQTSMCAHHVLRVVSYAAGCISARNSAFGDGAPSGPARLCAAR